MLAAKAQDGTSGFFHKPGLSRSDIADILGILPSGLAPHMPIVAMGGKYASQPEQLVLASKSLLYLFGVKTLDGLSRFPSKGKSGHAQRLADFAATLDLDAAPRTGKLRFRIGPATTNHTALCPPPRAQRKPPPFFWAG